MVQIKQKSNKINLVALITCFALIAVFVFGSVQFAFAASRKSIDNLLSEYSGNSSNFLGVEYGNQYSSIYCLQSFSGRICAVVELNGNSLNFGFVSDNPFTFEQYNQDGYTYPYSYDRKGSNGFYAFYSSTITLNDYKSSILTFGTFSDAYNYIQTGEANNPIFQPSAYDKSIPTPANISLTFNCEFGDSFKLEEIGHPFTMTWDNVQSSDNQVNYDDLTFECYVDMGYWAYKDMFGHHDDKTTGKIKLFDCSAMSKCKTCDKLGKNSDWDTWFSNVKLDIKAFGMLGQYYDFYCRYVDSSGNYGNWVKIHVSGSNSTINRKWGVIKDIDASTTVNKGYEEINGDSGEHVSGDYDNYYVGTPDGNLSNNLTSLKSNYSNLVSFYKELFSFLPAEIWIILVGLVSTMVVIAIIKFVRG